jgi:hypothetical protein
MQSDYLNQARTVLLETGFILNSKSIISKSEYYIYPNRTGEIRLSDHKPSKSNSNYTKIKPRINLIIRETTKSSKIPVIIASAIGYFFIKSKSYKNNHIQIDFEKILFELFLKKGSPIQGPEILKLFTFNQTPINGKNPYKNLQMKLYNSRKRGKITNIPNKGYWFKDKELN